MSERAKYIRERLNDLCADDEPAWLEAYAAMQLAYARHCGMFTEEKLALIAKNPQAFELLLPNNAMILTGHIARFSEEIDHACKKIAAAEEQVLVTYADHELPAALVMTFKDMLARGHDKPLASDRQRQ